MASKNLRLCHTVKHKASDGNYKKNFKMSTITDNISKIKHINEVIGYTPVVSYDYFLKDVLVSIVIIIVASILIMYLLRYFKVIKCDWFFSINYRRFLK